MKSVYLICVVNYDSIQLVLVEKEVFECIDDNEAAIESLSRSLEIFYSIAELTQWLSKSNAVIAGEFICYSP